ncbi:DUF397 domain-containing protein [Planomonospora sp. ID67723]|uniref:DUF397 domain-containing protein n=1 Tax=Planomonospora sp. ID67723 TaxID=2738134 RepID=UPI0027DCA03A|nr:DUF397 domain-containing protein [Planomonospora sp. ID67723]
MWFRSWVEEVADNLPGVVAVRDSKNPDGPKLVFAPAEWRAFVGGVKAGAFDRSA